MENSFSKLIFCREFFKPQEKFRQKNGNLLEIAV